MNYLNRTIEINIKDYLQKENNKCLVIYSNTTIKKNKIDINKENFKIYSTETLTIQKENIDEKITNLDSYKKVISIGGGTALDIGKYIAYKFNKEIIAIPSMLSTNAYSTNKVALFIKGKKETFDAVLPTKIYLDKEILNNSKENNIYGLVDIFSILTALNDWNISNKYNNEKITEEYKNAERLLKETVDYVLNNKKEEIENNPTFIYKIVGEAGEITNRHGSGRPESGSEHIFAKALEKEVKIPHAIAVANGILLMTIAQSICLEKEMVLDSYYAINKLEIYKLNKKYNINYNLIEKIFINLTPRIDRYTVIDLIYKNDKIKHQVLEKYKNIIDKED